MGHYDALLEDLRALQFERSLCVVDDDDEPVMVKAAPPGAYRAAPRRFDDGTDLAKALSPGAVHARTRDMEASRHCFDGIADQLIRRDEPLAKAQPAPAWPQFSEAVARATLAKAIADGQCSAREAAKAEALINRIAAGQAAARLSKAQSVDVDLDTVRNASFGLARTGTITAVDAARLDALRHAHGVA